MDSTQVVDLSREALRMAILLGGPALAAALVVALVVGVVQTVTQMNEPTLGLVARIAAVLVVVLIVLPWMLGEWVSFATVMIGGIPDRM